MSAAVATDYQFAPAERPAFPGSPFSPAHPPVRRLGYLAIGVLIGITASLGNALMTVNVAGLAGGLGLYTSEVNWLTAAYVAMNTSASLLLVKARIQFGIPPVTIGLLAAYALATLVQLAFPGFAAALLVRAISGMAGAGLTTVVINNLLQAFPARLRTATLVIGISIPQLTSPLARLVPVEMLSLSDWRGLTLIEFGIAATALTSLLLLPLPPSERRRAFEPLDYLTVALFVPAIALVCGVLSQGRLFWWTDTPWLGWALAAAIPLFAAVVLLELHRDRPLLQMGWLGSADILRFAAVALLVRFALAEQTYGAVGLLTFGGLNNDQLHILFEIVLVATLLGAMSAALTLSERRLPWLVMTASLLIAAAAWMDSDATNVTRPAQLYLSQALIAFGTTLFLGPALVYGLLRMLSRGPDHLVSFVVLFNMTQNLGGLIGSAALGSYQTASVRAHATALSEHLSLADPQVVDRIQSGTAALAGAIADPSLRAAQGAGLLGQAMTREASILAFNDVFRFVAGVALMTALYIFYLICLSAWRQRRATQGKTP